MKKEYLNKIAKLAFETFINNRKLILSYYDTPADFRIAWERAVEEAIDEYLILISK